MKFYFCETCGKRITEVELNEGSARNKQVKGIFCEDCAVGVNTIEFEPLKLEVNPSAPPRSTPSFGTPTARSTPKFGMSRSTPNFGAPIVRSTPNSGSPTVKEAALEEPLAVPKGLPASQKAMLVAAGFIMATGMAMLMVGLKKPAPTPVLIENSGVVQTPKVPQRPPALEIPAPSASPAKQEPPAAAAEVPTIPLTQPSDAESRAASSFEEVRQFRGLAADDAAGRAAVLEAFLKEHGDSIVAARARLLLESFKKAPESTPATAPAPNVVATIPVAVPEKTSTPPTPAALPVEPPKDDIAEADKACVVFLNDYVSLLRKHDRAGAAQSIGAADKNAVLKPLQKELAQNRKALGWYDDIEAALLAGVEKLRDADDFDLRSKSGQSMHVGKRAAFQFLGRKDETLRLGGKELEMSISMSTFSPQTWENLVELGLSGDAAGLLRRGFVEVLSLSSGDAVKRAAVKSTLAQARTAGAAAEDVDYVLRLIDVSTRGARESLAEDALRRFEKCFETKNWVEADRLGRQLLGDYADTSIVKSKTGLRDMVVSARAKGSPVRVYTLVFQEGEAIYDANIDKYSGTLDCYLYKDWPNTTYNDYFKGHHDITTLMMGPGWINPLIQFKVFQRQGGPLPDDAEIVNATLSVYKTGAYDPMMEASACAVPWKIDEVTWNSAAGNAPWKKPGGDASEYGTVKLKSKWDPGWCEFNVSESMRQGQKEGKLYGWFILATEQSNIVALASSKHSNAAWRPKLTLKVRTTAMK